MESKTAELPSPPPRRLKSLEEKGTSSEAKRPNYSQAAAGKAQKEKSPVLEPLDHQAAEEEAKEDPGVAEADEIPESLPAEYSLPLGHDGSVEKIILSADEKVR